VTTGEKPTEERYIKKDCIWKNKKNGENFVIGLPIMAEKMMICNILFVICCGKLRNYHVFYLKHRAVIAQSVK
jgi:hypothetical protein